MSKIPFEVQHTLNDLWVTEASKWIANNFSADLIQQYIDGEQDWVEIVDAMYEDDSGFDITILSKEDLIKECHNAIDKEMWDCVVLRAYALFEEENNYNSTVKYWAYNGNPVAITSSNFLKVLAQAKRIANSRTE